MKWFNCFFSITLLWAVVFAAPLFSQTPLVKIDPATVSTDVGETFSVDVAIEGAEELRGVSVKIEFDPAILEALSISSGGFMSGFGQTFSFSEKNNDEGWVQYDESILGSGDMAAGSGVICSIEFEAIANGVSALTFTTADLRDRDNSPITTDLENGTVMVGGSAVVVQLYAALEGPFDADNGVMFKHLAERDFLPLSSPYSSAPETVESLPANVVDWVLVQLRETPTGSTVAEKSCFLKTDGTVIQADGQANLTFWDIEEGSYYIVLDHRNHISIMSAEAVALSSEATEFDFSSSASNVYGGEAKLLNANPPVYGMFAGDGDASGQVEQVDQDNVLQDRDTSGYEANDYNLSGIVTVSDTDYAASNVGTLTNVPAN